MNYYEMEKVILSREDKQSMRCKFLEKKCFVMSLFGTERQYNIAMLFGELNVLMGIGVYSEEIGTKMQKDLMSLL